MTEIRVSKITPRIPPATVAQPSCIEARYREALLKNKSYASDAAYRSNRAANPKYSCQMRKRQQTTNHTNNAKGMSSIRGNRGTSSPLSHTSAITGAALTTKTKRAAAPRLPQLLMSNPHILTPGCAPPSPRGSIRSRRPCACPGSFRRPCRIPGRPPLPSLRP